MKYREKRVRQSEMLQLLLLDHLYSQKGSENIIFQGGTALRWIFGGMRFSEDIDFVTRLSRNDIESLFVKTLSKTRNACIAQFGPGLAEQQTKRSRKSDLVRFIPQNIFSVYREEKFQAFIDALRQVTADILDQGMRSFLKTCTKKNPH